MARYVAALLGWWRQRAWLGLAPATVAGMFQPHYEPDPRIPGVGLAFFRADLGNHPAVEHQPLKSRGLLGQLLGVPDETIRADVPQHPEIWGDICGRYRLPARLTDLRL